MKILEQGCQCDHCLTNTKKSLKEAREQWKDGEREIVFQSYQYTCGDGCCDNYGTRVYINGFELGCDGESVEQVSEYLMEFLEIDNVTISFESEDD